MTPMSPVEAKTDALARFNDAGPGHINCGQALVRYTLLVRGYDPDLVKTAQFFGGGIAGIGEVCGAVSGAALSLGLCEYHHAARKDETPASPGSEQPPMPDRLLELMRGFAQQFGALRCRDLTGCDLTTPEARDAFHNSDVHLRCADFVGWAIDHLTPLLLDL
jgi:C_GCAxxG_C_C family probable redox protein